MFRSTGRGAVPALPGPAPSPAPAAARSRATASTEASRSWSASIRPLLRWDAKTAVARISGGSAEPAPPVAGCPAGASACASEPTPIESDPAPFGIVAPTFVPDFFNADGIVPERRAGSHPDLLSGSVRLQLDRFPPSGEGGPTRSLSRTASATIRVDASTRLPRRPDRRWRMSPRLLWRSGDALLSSQVGRIEVMVAGDRDLARRVNTPPSLLQPHLHPRGAAQRPGDGRSAAIRSTSAPRSIPPICTRSPTHDPDINETLAAVRARS